MSHLANVLESAAGTIIGLFLLWAGQVTYDKVCGYEYRGQRD